MKTKVGNLAEKCKGDVGEMRYGLSSARFYRRYQSGKLDDRNDFIDWAGEYQIYLLLREQIASLRGMKIDRR